MAFDITTHESKAVEFNTLYHSHFSFYDFTGKTKTFISLGQENCADIVYRGMLTNVLKDALAYACHQDEEYTLGNDTSESLLTVLDEFEYTLMRPFAHDRKKNGIKPYPSKFGGMTEKDKIDLIERVIDASPTNDIELTEKAYKEGHIKLRDIRRHLNDIDPNPLYAPDDIYLKRAGAFMIAIENVNKSRPMWWRIIHPFRNNAEQRDASEIRNRLMSFGENALARARNLAGMEYKTLTLTKEGLNKMRAALENPNPIAQNENNLIINEKENIKDSVNIDLKNDLGTEVTDKIEDKKIDATVIIKEA